MDDRDTQPALALSGVKKTFGKTIAVDSMDLVVPRGGLYGVIGPNDAGKTTCIRMIMSILFPTPASCRSLGGGPHWTRRIGSARSLKSIVAEPRCCCPRASSTPPPVWQVWVSVGIGLASALAVTWFAAKVFRVGLLMHGKPPNSATLVRWARAA
jgi:energy-coupling factor transporter ATP-binding protein EcfA2